MISKDGLLFALAWLALFWSSGQSGMIVPTKLNDLSLTTELSRVLVLDWFPVLWEAALGVYIAADVWLLGRAQSWGKKIALWCMIGGFVILPTLAAIAWRQSSAPHLYIHDGAIQVEQAVRFFLGGQNPYSVDYTHTPMGDWSFSESALNANPALYHLPYLPLLWLETIPFDMIMRSTVGWYDVRFVYLLLFVGSVMLILHTALFGENRYSASIFLALNPLLVPFFVEGRNDIVVTFWLLAAVLLLKKNHLTWAGLAVAAAASSKQTAWFILPFFVLYMWSLMKDRDFRARIMPFLPGLALIIFLIVPFLFWDFHAFWDDIISFQSGAGGGATNYPIKSLGFGALLPSMGLIEHNTDAFPFVSFQLILGVPILAVLLWMQQRQQTLNRLVLNYALFLIFILFFSRTFNDNHLGYAITWLVFGFLLNVGAANGEDHRVQFQESVS